MRMRVAVDVVRSTPVVVLEFDRAELFRVMEGASVRVPAAAALSSWRPVLGEQPWAVDVAVTLAPDGRGDGMCPVRWFGPDEEVAMCRVPEAEVLSSATVTAAPVLPAEVVCTATWTRWSGPVTAVARWAAVVREVAAVLEAAGLDPADLVGGVEPAPWCGCLCPTHREDGMFCEGEATGRVTLTPNRWVPDPRPIAMCAPCGGWWVANRPGRVVSVGPLAG